MCVQQKRRRIALVSSEPIYNEGVIDAMRVESIVSEIHERLEVVGDPQRRTIANSYAPTVMRVIGVTVPNLRVIVRDVAKRLKVESPDQVLSLAHKLLEGGTFEGRQVAYELLSRHRPTFATLETREVERLGKGIDNWISVDTFAGLIAGPAWREHSVTDVAIVRWACSDDRWWRRAALVSTIPLNQKSKGGIGDTPRTLLICNILADDHNEMVVKGLSWALRELSKSDKQATFDFLSKHDSVIASRVRREVGNKLRSGLKTPGHRG